LIATAGQDRAARLWDAAHGTLVGNLPGHTDAVYSLSFSPDSRLLASGSLDRTVKLWDVPSRSMQVTLHAGESRAVGVRSRPEVENPTLVPGGHVGRVRGVTFTPGGRLLATVTEDGTVRLWDVLTDKSI
jgi:WD40 repeat protein